MTLADKSELDLCSAKGCQAPATWQLRWNNPKLHTPDRRKTWLACEQHKASLSDFLGSRGFLKEVVPHESADDSADRPGDRAGDQAAGDV